LKKFKNSKKINDFFLENGKVMGHSNDKNEIEPCFLYNSFFDKDETIFLPNEKSSILLGLLFFLFLNNKQKKKNILKKKIF
jgi:hypothetical protein